jgi:hypothetical protein
MNQGILPPPEGFLHNGIDNLAVDNAVRWTPTNAAPPIATFGFDRFVAANPPAAASLKTSLGKQTK